MSDSARQSRIIRRVLLPGLLLALGLWLLAGWAVVAVVTAPRPSPIDPITTLAGASVSDVSVDLDGRLELRGWLAHDSEREVVILFAGIGADRRSMLGPAAHYVARGWSVLLPDLRGTGESGGKRVGLGYLERRDVRKWVTFARSRGFESIALHGHSLGAAAIAYAVGETGDDFLRFVVLDSCYDDVRNALANRLPWIPLPGLSLKPVEWFGAAVLDARVDDLRPVARVESMQSPVLFIAGDLDSKARPAETRRLFDACGSNRKQLRWIAGARHVNLWSHDPEAYASALDGFLSALPARSPHLPQPPSSEAP